MKERIRRRKTQDRGMMIPVTVVWSLTSTKVMARAMSVVALQEKIFRHQIQYTTFSEEDNKKNHAGGNRISYFKSVDKSDDGGALYKKRRYHPP